jgi:hypothetical protein
MHTLRNVNVGIRKKYGGFLESTSRQGQACPWDN